MVATLLLGSGTGSALMLSVLMPKARFVFTTNRAVTAIPVANDNFLIEQLSLPMLILLISQVLKTILLRLDWN